MSENNHENLDLETITLTSEDGDEYEAYPLALFDFNEKECIALELLEPEEDEDPIIFFEVEDVENAGTDDEEMSFLPIESDEDYELIAKHFYKLISEQE